ncbi:MAG: thioredoxin-disulfide reductase [Proteobacteria bacterium]|nr:thioredoxin-disulfide reductase [Pseudomonadota bacterium]
MREVIVLGSGPAGLTAALYTARANLSPLLIHGPLPGGQLTTTTHVENFPGFEEGIMGPDLMEQMRKQAVRFGTEIVESTVTKIDFSKQPYTVFCDEKSFQAKTIIIATGASAKTLGLEREWELMGYGVSTCATCDGAFFKDQEIVVVGGGDSACEEAMFLTKFGKRVRLIHRRDTLRASKIMAQRTIDHPKIEILWNSVPEKLLGDRKQGITGLILKDTVTGENKEIQCNAVFYGIGHTPNTKLFEGVLNMDENKYLITKPDSTATNIPGVFACGDVKDHVYRQAITAAGSGCMAAIECERFLAGQGH